jgi:hypothetical protein
MKTALTRKVSAVSFLDRMQRSRATAQKHHPPGGQ